MVDVAAVAAFDVTLLELREAPAKAKFRDFIKDAPECFDLNEEAMWHGMRFSYKTGIAAQ
jgi:hypothetical protein